MRALLLYTPRGRATPSSGSMPSTLRCFGSLRCFSSGSKKMKRQSSSSSSPARHPKLLSRHPKLDQSMRKGSSVIIAGARLDQLLDAEIVSLGLREPRRFTLQDVLAFDDAVTLGNALLTELPVRYAHRIKLLSSIPNWRDNEAFVAVRQLYVQSFKDLRSFLARKPEILPHHESDNAGGSASGTRELVLASEVGEAEATRRLATTPLPESSEDIRRLYDTLATIHKRHSRTTRLLLGCRSLGLPAKETNELLDKIFLGRISTNFLTRRFLELAEPRSRYMSLGAGIVDPACDVVKITRNALNQVKRLALGKYNINLEAHIRPIQQPVFAYPTNHLYFILFEVLLNAASATVKRTRQIEMEQKRLYQLDREAANKSDSLRETRIPPQTAPQSVDEIAKSLAIEIVVTGDEENCAIRFRDRAGGIPEKQMPSIFNYLHTTWTGTGTAVHEHVDSLEAEHFNFDESTGESLEVDNASSTQSTFGTTLKDQDAEELSEQHFRTVTFAGGGCGLPLARLYARYLGGRLEVNSVPGLGVDVVLFVSRVRQAEIKYSSEDMVLAGNKV
ncbi:unnamed protein product [Amoebophrya sp. A25]|nr:unnamed protein product [Amoebophrya sp. A25]|eukprot:GSA25T00019380001.1